MTANKKTIPYIVTAFFLLNTFLFSYNSANAQGSSSPYTRYGLGDINSRSHGQTFAMGGTTLALQNDTSELGGMFFINNANPASYANMRLTTAELGMNYNRLRLESSTAHKTLNNASFGYVNIAFPIFKRWWGASIGLMPYSSVGYKISDHENLTNIGGVDYLYEGNGGVSQVYFGNGIKPLYGLYNAFMRSSRYQRLKKEGEKYKIYKIAKRKKSWQALSLGVNASYLFGNIDNTKTSIFSSGGFYNTRTGTTSRIGDIYFDYGAQYSITIDSLHGRDLKENVKILFGATFAAQTNVQAKIDSLSYNYYTSSTGYEIVKDTAEFVNGHKGTVTLPLSFGFGIGFKKGDRLMVAADFAIQNWSSYQAFNSNEGLKNSMRVSLGMQYIPNSGAAIGHYMQRVNYRAGVRYAETALELKNSQLNEYALSLGAGFPVGRNYILRSFSMINIGVEVGQRGTTTNGLIKEQFFKATVGFTINDRWFVKPRID
ncbi:MAG: hypothetical protein JWP12_1988 [Bacteroidetes bacterium]|nr:hypothetical protein [Bacteroidota bacterium]